MKKIVSLLFLILIGAVSAEQPEVVTENQGQEIVVQSQEQRESEAFLEKKPSLKDADFNPRKRSFDALDVFVDSSNYASAHINTIDLWFTSAYVMGKFLYHGPYEFPGNQKYLVLLMVTLGATGILKLGVYCRYYLYRFVRGGVEAIAPAKMVGAFNQKMASLERYSFLASFAGVSCALAAYVAFGSIEKHAALSITGYLLRPFLQN